MSTAVSIVMDAVAVVIVHFSCVAIDTMFFMMFHQPHNSGKTMKDHYEWDTRIAKLPWIDLTLYYAGIAFAIVVSGRIVKQHIASHPATVFVLYGLSKVFDFVSSLAMIILAPEMLDPSMVRMNMIRDAVYVGGLIFAHYNHEKNYKDGNDSIDQQLTEASDVSHEENHQGTISSPLQEVSIALPTGLLGVVSSRMMLCSSPCFVVDNGVLR